jgi:hypothetical protein
MCLRNQKYGSEEGGTKNTTVRLVRACMADSSAKSPLHRSELPYRSVELAVCSASLCRCLPQDQRLVGIRHRAVDPNLLLCDRVHTQNFNKSIPSSSYCVRRGQAQGNKQSLGLPLVTAVHPADSKVHQTQQWLLLVDSVRRYLRQQDFLASA